MSCCWFCVLSSSRTLCLCLQHLPDCVGDLVDTETAGWLWSLLSTVPPHVPLPLRHELEGLSSFGPVLWLHRLHGIKSVHVSGSVCYSKQATVSSPSQISLFISTQLTYGRPTGPEFVSLHSFPAQSSSARAAVSLRNHKHTVNVALSQRTLIWSCIKKTKKHTHAE